MKPQNWNYSQQASTVQFNMDMTPHYIEQAHRQKKHTQCTQIKCPNKQFNIQESSEKSESPDLTIFIIQSPVSSVSSVSSVSPVLPVSLAMSPLYSLSPPSPLSPLVFYLMPAIKSNIGLS